LECDDPARTCSSLDYFNSFDFSSDPIRTFGIDSVQKCRKIDFSENGDVKVDVKASNDIVTALIKLNDRRQVKNGARAQFISRRKRTCSFRLPFRLDISQTNATSFFFRF
jgi:hypothetical protein